MYLVSIISLLYYIGTKKKIVLFFTRPPLPHCSNPPHISFWRNFHPPPPPHPRLFQTPRLFGTREYWNTQFMNASET